MGEYMEYILEQPIEFIREYLNMDIRLDQDMLETVLSTYSVANPLALKLLLDKYNFDQKLLNKALSISFYNLYINNVKLLLNYGAQLSFISSIASYVLLEACHSEMYSEMYWIIENFKMPKIEYFNTNASIFLGIQRCLKYKPIKVQNIEREYANIYFRLLRKLLKLDDDCINIISQMCIPKMHIELWKSKK